MSNISVMLDELSILRSNLSSHESSFLELLKGKLSPADFDAYVETKDAFDKASEEIRVQVAAKELEIKSSFHENDSVINGKTLQVYWKSGNSSWDTDKLVKLSATVPEILSYRKVGKSSVTIREIPTGKTKG